MPLLLYADDAPAALDLHASTTVLGTMYHTMTDQKGSLKARKRRKFKSTTANRLNITTAYDVEKLSSTKSKLLLPEQSFHAFDINLHGGINLWTPLHICASTGNFDAV